MIIWDVLSLLLDYITWCENWQPKWFSRWFCYLQRNSIFTLWYMNEFYMISFTANDRMSIVLSFDNLLLLYVLSFIYIDFVSSLFLVFHCVCVCVFLLFLLVLGNRFKEKRGEAIIDQPMSLLAWRDNMEGRK